MSPVNTFSLYHSQSVHMSSQLYGDCIALSYACSLALAYPLGAIADRIHPLRIGLITIAAYAVVTAFGFFTAHTVPTFYVSFLLHTVISGCYFTATASIGQRLLPRAKFAEISSAGGIIGGIIAMFVPPGLGLFIKWMHNDYRYVFLLASIAATATCLSYLLLLQEYNARGGDAAFVPPE
jgi:MFS family permease